MSPLPSRSPALLLGVGVTTLLVGGLAARGASASLVSPLPSVGVGVGVTSWLVVGAGLILLLRHVAAPRLVRRLLVGGVLAVTGWSMGTIGRALYVTSAFALEEVAEEEATTFRVIGTPAGEGTQTLAVTSLAYRRSVSVPFDAAAAEEIAPFSTCVSLPVERTTSGVTRVRLPDGPLGADDLESCPAVSRVNP